MQGTISSFDAARRSGTALLDDGTEVGFENEAFDRGGLRLLRPGQRVRLDVGAAGEIVRVTIPTLG
jgi:cold shock CspA family protein